MSITRQQSGFTLIELLLYVGIVGMLLVSLTAFFNASVEARLKGQTIAEVDQQGTYVMDMITSSIRNASSITVPVAGTPGPILTLVVPTGSASPTSYTLNGTTLQITEGLNAAIALTNSNVQVSNLAFTNLTRSGTPGIVRVSFTLTRVNTAGRNEYSYSQTFTNSAEVTW